jgi:hypothetical protein
LSKKNKETTPCPDTGGWEKIYQGPFLETPSSSFGTDISIKGEVMRLPKRRVVEETMSPISPQSGPIVKGYPQSKRAGTDEPGGGGGGGVAGGAAGPIKKGLLSVAEDRKVRSGVPKQALLPRERLEEGGVESQREEEDGDEGGRNASLDDSDSDQEGGQGAHKSNRRNRSAISGETRHKGAAAATTSQPASLAHSNKSKKTDPQGLSSIPIKTFAMEL